MNTSLFFGIRYAGNEKYSSGFSIASIGLPAVILPKRGTSTVLFEESTNSFNTNNSIALFLESCFLITPFFSRLLKCA